MSEEEKKLLKVLGKNIQRNRQEKGISQEILSKKCGINRSYLSELESGTRNTTIIIIYRISTALGISVNTLLN